MNIKHYSAITIIRNTASIVILLATQILLARILGPEKRGEFAVCLTFMNILVMFSNFGINNANTFLVADNKVNQSEALGLSFLLGGLFSGFGIILGLSAINIPITFFEKAKTANFIFALVAITPAVLFLYTVGILRGSKRYVEMNISLLANPVILCCSIFLFCYGFRWSINGALLAYGTASTACVLINLWFLRTEFNLFLMRKALFRINEVISYASRGFGGDVLSTLNIQIPTLILPFFTTSKNIGFFAIAVTLVSKLWIVPDSLTLVSVPYVAINREGFCEQIESILRKVILVLAIGAFAMGLIINPVILKGFGTDFEPVIGLVLVLLPGALFRGAGKIVSGFLLGIDRPGTNSIIKVIVISLNVILIIIMVPVWSLWGAAIATSMSYGLEGILYLALYRKISGKHKTVYWFPRIEDIRYLSLVTRKFFFNRGIKKKTFIPGDVL